MVHRTGRRSWIAPTPAVAPTPGPASTLALVAPALVLAFGLAALLQTPSCVRAGFDAAPPGEEGDGGGAREGGSTGDGDAAGDAAGGGWKMTLPADCSPATWPKTTYVVKIGTGDSLKDAIATARRSTTILLAEGTHTLAGGGLLDTERVVLRGESGNASKVIVDLKGASVGFGVAASEVVIADLSLSNVKSDGVHVHNPGGEVKGVVLFNLVMRDVEDHFVHVNWAQGRYVDSGVAACLKLTVSDTFRTSLGRKGCHISGITLAAARGWRLFGNVIQGIWCPAVLSAAIQLRDGTRDVMIERNRILDPGVGIRTGLNKSPQGRTYADGGCQDPTSGPADNFGGVVRNNFIAARPVVGNHDSGIAAWNSCDTVIVHNSVFSGTAPYSSIEWRWANSRVEVYNNLVSHTLQQRDSATAVKKGNVTGAGVSWFTKASTGDLHLVSTATGAIDRGAALPAGTCTADIDGDKRDAKPDVGADER